MQAWRRAKQSNTAGTTSWFSQKALTWDSHATACFIIKDLSVTELVGFLFLMLPYLCLKNRRELAHVKREYKCQETCYTVGMNFPILDLVDDELAIDWLLKDFHLHGLKWPHCGAGVVEIRHFRQTATSQLTVHQCLQCQGIYNLYSSTYLTTHGLYQFLT